MAQHGLVEIDFDPFPDEPALSAGLVEVGFDPILDEPTRAAPLARGRFRPAGVAGVDQEADEEIGRLATAGGEFLRGLGDIASGTLKAISIGSVPNARQMLPLFEAIDRGEDVPLSAAPELYQGFVLKYENAGPDERRAMQQEFAEFDPRTSPLFEAGTKLDAFVERHTLSNPEFAEEFFAGKLPRGFGSMTGFMAVGIASRGVGLPAVIAPSILGALVNRTDTFEDALRSGSTIEEAYTAGDFGTIVGLSEGLPIAMILSRLDKGTGGRIKNALLGLMLGGTEEFVQEVGQTILTNLIASDIVGYDPTRDLFVGTGDAAGVGFTTGAVMGFLTSLVGGRRGGGTGPGDPEFTRTAQEIAVESLTPPPRPVPPGERERVAAAPPPELSAADEASPIRDDIQKEGQAILRDAEASESANAILRRNNLPLVGARVIVTLPDGETAVGEVTDAFQETNAELGFTEDGIKVALDDGGVFEEFVTDMDQRGIVVAEQEVVSQSEADITPAAPEGLVAVDFDPFEGEAETIAAVALRDPTGQVFVGTTHALAAEEGAAEFGQTIDDFLQTAEEGFTTSTGRFIAREEAQEIAANTQQTLRPQDTELDSSDLAAAVEGPDVSRETLPTEPVSVPGEKTSTLDEVAAAAARVEPDPTPGQVEADNYRQGPAKFRGMGLTIETPKGGTRRDTKHEVPEWVVENFPAHYGKVLGTKAADGEHLDFFLGDNLDSDRVFVIDQKEPETGKFDETKTFFAMVDQAAALDVYSRAFTDGSGPDRVQAITEVSVAEYQEWLDKGDTTKAFAGRPQVAGAPEGVAPPAGPGPQAQEPVSAPPAPEPETAPTAAPERAPEQLTQPDLLGGPEVVESEQIANERADAIIEEARAADLSDQEIHDNLAELAEGDPAGGLDLPASSELSGDLAMIRRVDDRLEAQRASTVSKQEQLKRKLDESRKGRATAAKETKQGKLKAKAQKKRAEGSIGLNRDGEPIFEDENGVRSVVVNGIRRTEAIAIVPTRGGIAAGRPASRSDEFKTIEQIEREFDPSSDEFQEEIAVALGQDIGETKPPETPILGAQEPTDDGLQHPVPTGDEGQGAADVQPAAPDRGDERPPQGQVRGGAPAVRRPGEGQAQAPERPGGRGVQPPGDRGTGVRDVPGLPGRPDQPSGRPARDEPRRDPDKGDNLSIAKNGLNEGRGPVAKARGNIRVIELVRQIEAEGRPATKSEQDDLALYVGWGGLKGVFPDSQGGFTKGFEEVGGRLRELLDETEYATARRSLQYAHYTSETIVRGMWQAAEKLGFHDGKVFEPGMGIGNFAGFMPADLAGKVDYSGLELDHMTVRIARLLYPQHGIRRDDFTRSPLPADTYDLAIGNPPFADIPIKSDPAYKQGFLLHDYFFVKSLDGVRPGGLLMFISSAGTLNKADTKARDYMADRADFVAAIRLPGNAFERNAGTSVTTDIIILRKRLPGETPGSRDWTQTVEVTLPDSDGKPTTGLVNKWIADNPDAVLGEPGFFDKLFKGRYGVRAFKDANLAAQINARIQALPDDIMSKRQTADERAEVDFGTAERKEGSFYIKDGQLFQLSRGLGRPVQRRGKGVVGGKTAANIERIEALIPIRDALRATYAADLANDTENGDRARKRLNSSYDAFVGKYGPINTANRSWRRPSVVQQESARAEAREEARVLDTLFDEGSFDATDMLHAGASMQQVAAARRAAREAAGRDFDEGTFNPTEMPDLVLTKRPNIDPFMDDQEGYRLRAIEAYDLETGEASKTDVFTKNVITREVEPQINSVNDAVLFVLNQTGRLDIPEVARAAGKTESEVIEELADSIFLSPGTQDTWVTRDEYLSGDVRKKLRQAQEAAKRNDAFQRNADALEAAQPPPLSPAEIKANLGMPWLPTETIEAFGKEALGLESLRVGYIPKLALWTVRGDDSSPGAVTTWGTVDMPAPTLIANALNRQVPRVTRYDPIDRRQVLDPAATEAATTKMQEIKDRFSEWLWEDSERAATHAELYNLEYNNLIAREFNGDYLTTPGVSTSWSWRPHQRRVVARIIQDGNTYMAHAVGAGKTSAMIGAGMEMRRLGLVRKPMYVVPNHMLGQFTKEFYEQYPTAKIAVADDRQFHTSKRKQFMADVANTDLDAIIITHTSFGLIPISHEFQDGMINAELVEFRSILQDLQGDQSQRFTRRRIELAIERLEQRLSGRAAGARDQVFTFEEMGVDFLFMDEAHEFRKLDFATKMSSMKGIDPLGSGKSWDLFVKTRYLETINPGRNLVLASGTPVTNTMAELYTVSRYIQQEELDSRGLGHFDAWAGAYGETLTEIEQNAAGGYKPATRFANFVNIPELSTMMRQRMDVITSEQLSEFVIRPKLKDGKRSMHLAERSDDVVDYQKTLERRMEAIQARKGPPQPGDDILLTVIGDGRKAAIDMRLVSQRFANDPGSKLNLLVDEVFKIWEESKRQPFHGVTADGYTVKPVDTGGGTQMVFANLGVTDKSPLNVHKYIRSELVRRGVPRAEIALMSEHRNNPAARQRVFNDMNDSTLRVLIGSTQMMATGVNAQRHMIAVHNLDPLWYPSLDEQRNGRLMRQGNMNPEVQIHQYSTKGTYDSQMWGMMARKARFIEGFFRGDPFIRNMEDFGEASQFEQAKAMTTADPRLIELADLKQKLERARRRQSSFESDQYAIANRVARAGNEVEFFEDRVTNIQADIATRTDTTGDNFTAVAQGKTFEDRLEFGNALLDQIDALKEAGKARKRVKLGSIGGFDIAAASWRTKPSEPLQTAVWVARAGDRESTVAIIGSSRGFVQSIQAVLRGFESNLEGAQARIAKAKKEIADFTPQMGKTFEGGAEIADLAAKAAVIEKELASGVVTGQPQADPEPVAEEELAQLGVVDIGERRPRFRAQARFSFGPVNPRLAGDVEAIETDLLARLDKLGIAEKVALRLVEDIKVMVDGKTSEVFGRFTPGLIEVSLAGKDGRWVLNHEVIHALRELKLIRDAEWTTLSKAAKADTGRVARMREQRKGLDLTEEEIVEELVADMFADWAVGRTQTGGFIKRAFEHIRDFLLALGETLRGRNYFSANDIFTTIERGEVGRREPGARRDPAANPSAAREAYTLGRTPPAPEHERTIKRIIGTTDKPVSQRLRERVAAFRDRDGLALKQGLLDEFAVVEEMEVIEHGKLQDASFSAFKAAHATKNLGSVMATILRHGPLKIEGGWFVLDRQFGKGFEDIFKPLADSGKLRLWKGWAVAVRAERLKREGRERLLSDAEIAELLPLGQENPEFQRVMDEWIAFNKKMLDMAEAAGLINAAQRTIWEKADYVPFYRILEDEETVVAAKKGRAGLADQRSGIRTLKGGTSPINDPLENMVMNMTSLVDRSFKNLAMRKIIILARRSGAVESVGRDWKPALITVDEAVKKLEERGIEIEKLSSKERREVIKMFQLAAPQAPDIVSVMVDGRPVYYRVLDPLLLRSITSMSPPQLTGIAKLMRLSKRVLTTGVTIDPAFMIANFLRDTTSAWVVAGQKGFTPGVDSLRGFVKALKEDDSLIDIMAAGGGSGGFFRTDPEDVRKLIEARITGLDRQRVLDSPRKLWELYQRIGQASEAANRIAIFDAVIKNGGTKAEAAYQARDVMDFTMRGDYAAMRFLIETVPFLNARVQGLYRLYRGARDNPVGFLLRGSAITAATMALMAVNWDRPEYDELEDWDKDVYYHFWIGDEHYRLPKGFEVGAIFSTIPERMLRFMMGKDDGKKAGQRVLAMFRDTFALNPIPQLFKPMVEQWANRVSFTGRPIVGQGLERLTPEAQWSPWTSETARALGRSMPEFLGEARSPKRIEHLVRGYFGALGTYVLSASDAMVRLAGDGPAAPAFRIDDVPVVKRFVRADPARNTVYVTDFYDIQRDVSRLLNTLNKKKQLGAADEALAFLAANKGKLLTADFVENTRQQLSEVNRLIRRFESDAKLSPAVKRRKIDFQITRKNRIARAAMKRLSLRGVTP